MLQLGELPRKHRRCPEIAGLAGLDDLVQGFHGFVDRCVVVEPVYQVDIDVVGSEATQRSVDLFHDRFARQALPARSVVHLARNLGGDDDVLASGVLLDSAPDELLRAAQLIDVRGVPQGDAELDRLLEEGLRGSSFSDH